MYWHPLTSLYETGTLKIVDLFFHFFIHCMAEEQLPPSKLASPNCMTVFLIVVGLLSLALGIIKYFDYQMAEESASPARRDPPPSGAAPTQTTNAPTYNPGDYR